jgi:dihydrofolate reductase
MTPRPAAPTPPVQNRPRESHGSPTVTKPAIALIAAVAANGVIGVGNRLPWRLTEDLKRFRALTAGHAVIMGRKTWESLPRPLPERQNIVVTRQRGYVAEGAEVAGSFDAALALVRLPEPVFCIGGGEIFGEALARAQRLYLTQIDRDFEGDARFPPWRADQWKEISRESKRSDQSGGFDYAYVTYERTASDD